MRRISHYLAVVFYFFRNICTNLHKRKEGLSILELIYNSPYIWNTNLVPCHISALLYHLIIHLLSQKINMIVTLSFQPVTHTNGLNIAKWCLVEILIQILYIWVTKALIHASCSSIFNKQVIHQ